MAKKVQDSVDRISALSDEALCHIISFLPTKDVVRTSILSKRWRYLSASTSNLDFEFHSYESNETLYAFMNFVDRVLFLRRKPTIVRFRLSCCYGVDPLRISGWIHAVLCRSIEEFDLSISGLDKPDVLPDVLPTGLFICKTLVVLRLSEGVCLKVASRVFLPSLKVLDLRCRFKDKVFGGWLHFGCPVLEDLVLVGGFLEENCRLNVTNASLRRLTIRVYSLHFSGCGIVGIIVDAQNLVYLKYDGCEDNFLSSINLPSLTEAWIDFSQPNGTCTDYRTSATHLVRGIKNIRLLNIFSETLWDLNAESVPLPWFQNVMCLRTSVSGKLSFLGLVRLLQHSNSLKTLVMEEMPTTGYVEDWLELGPRKVPVTELPCLKSIEILEFEGDESHMEIVQYFLENAKVLEKLTIFLSGEEKHQLEISKELLMLPRVSKKCQVRIV